MSWIVCVCVFSHLPHKICTSDFFRSLGALKSFPNLSMHQNHLEDVRTQITGSHAQFSDSVGGTCSQQFLSLTKSQVIMMLSLLPDHTLKTIALKYHPFKILASPGFSFMDPRICGNKIVNTEIPRE